MKKKRWVPKENDLYYMITIIPSEGVRVKSLQLWSALDYHKENIRTGNCFRTTREALAAAKKIRKILKESP